MASDGHQIRNATAVADVATGVVQGGRAPFARLVAGSGLQFIDLELPAGPLALTFSRFVEEQDADAGPLLIPLRQRPDHDGLDWHPVTNRSLGPDESLWLTGYSGLEPFLGTWLPLPYLRVLGGGSGPGPARYDNGPANWARLYLGQPASDLRQAASLEAVLAFDTRLDPVGRLDQDQYLAPGIDDARLASEFRLVADPEALSGFLAETWLDSWVLQAFTGWRRRLGREAASPPAFRLEHVARYLALLQVLEHSGVMPAVRFADTFSASSRVRTLGLDLALDIGDDRTAAMLIGVDDGSSPADLADAEPLRLRDLACPTLAHAGPFPTLGEFDRPAFGNTAASRLSGRPDAFFWPSLLRVGEEAVRLSQRSGAMPGLTGLGALRSALTDTTVRATAWRFSRDEAQGPGPGPVVAGELLAHLAEDGTVVGEAGAATAPVVRPRFSPSTMLTLYLAEIVLQAVAGLNPPAAPPSGGEVRYLRRLVLTCPAAADEAERRLLRQRAEAGIAIVWRAFGWSDAGGPTSPPRPQVVLGLDPGLAAQVVYLHDEVQGRFGGNARQFVGLTRGGDSTTAGIGSLTIGSLDLAAGATSLAIVDYDLGREGSAHPQIVVADRSTVAGDSLTDTVARAVVLPAIAEALALAGHPAPGSLLEAELAHGGATGRHLDGRLAHRIVRPAAAALLGLYRDLPQGIAAPGLSYFTLATLVARGGGGLAPFDRQLEAIAEAGGAREFRLQSVRIGMQPRALSALIGAHFDPLLARVADAVRYYACDLLLLAGPNAALADVRRILLDRLPLAPHRIVDLAQRRLALIDGIRTFDRRLEQLRLIPLAGASLVASRASQASGLALLASGLDTPAMALRDAGLAALGHAPAMAPGSAAGHARSPRLAATLASPSAATGEAP